MVNLAFREGHMFLFGERIGRHVDLQQTVLIVDHVSVHSFSIAAVLVRVSVFDIPNATDHICHTLSNSGLLPFYDQDDGWRDLACIDRDIGEFR